MTQPPGGRSTGDLSIAAAEAPESDLIEPATAVPEWPPVGAYPDEAEPPAPDTAEKSTEPDAATAETPAVPDAAIAETGPGPDAATAETAAVPGTATAETGPGPDAATAETAAVPGTATSETVAESAEPGTTVGAAAGQPGGADVPGWQQPPPTEPFHARHEKPGEWQTAPPEHLAWEHSPPADVQPGVQDEPTEAIPLGMLPQPWQVPFDPRNAEPTAPLAQPRQRRLGLLVSLGLIITALICVGGTASAVLLLRDADAGKGAPDPATAVDRFLTAVYTDQDAAAAGEYVCREARNEKKLRQHVDQIKEYASGYEAPSFRWADPAVAARGDDSADVAVQLTMTTADEKEARQDLKFTVVRKTGWLVCDIHG
jgi:hypothetical protein